MYQFRVRQPVVQNAAQASDVAALQGVMKALGAKDVEFAASLVSNYYRYGQLSDKQMAWVSTLTNRATTVATPAPAAARLTVQAIQDLFDRASKHLKRVRVRLQAADATPVVFARAGASSKYAGQILITDGEGYGVGRWFGRIDTNGDFFPSGKATDAVKSLVMEFAEDPAATAGRYGRLTGGCSFCNHGLKDERSTRVGYGPVCAGNFGLPWGVK
jgi:hypothetical protein